MEKRVRILCQKGLLLKSSFLFLSISAMPALAIGGNTLKIDNTDEVVVLQKGKTIRGTVEDALGPITGANVVIKGSTIGVITDIDGRFVLENVPSNAILQISFMGYVLPFCRLRKTYYRRNICECQHRPHRTTRWRHMAVLPQLGQVRRRRVRVCRPFTYCAMVGTKTAWQLGHW